MAPAGKATWPAAALLKLHFKIEIRKQQVNKKSRV